MNSELAQVTRLFRFWELLVHVLGDDNMQCRQHMLLGHSLPQHAAHQVLVSPLGAGLCADHEANSLVEHVDLMRLQVLDDARQPREQLRDERLRLPHLRINSQGLGLPPGGAAGHEQVKVLCACTSSQGSVRGLGCDESRAQACSRCSPVKSGKHLDDYELPLALVADLQEGLASHVLQHDSSSLSRSTSPVRRVSEVTA